jgi:outer membrane protein assembly factor BamC
MIKLFQKGATNTAVLVALSLTGCARFNERLQANGDFNYQNSRLTPAYQTADFSQDEARTKYNLPVLTESQIEAGYLGKDVDIRPPTQFMPIIDGVLLTPGQGLHTQALFTASKPEDNIKDKVWELLKTYLIENGISLNYEDKQLMKIETAVFSQKNTYSGIFVDNEVLMQESYRFSLVTQPGNASVLLNIELLSYAESNDGKKLKFSLTDKRKHSIEVRFINDLLAFAYYRKQADELNKLDQQPLTIKLGFDENHQTTWIVENSFADTWRKLPDLLTLLHFEILEADRNLGYFSVKFNTPDEEYWQENNLNPFVLNAGKYYLQLGEAGGSKASILWLDSGKKPLQEQQVTDIYLSITEQIRSVLVKKDKQTKAL